MCLIKPSIIALHFRDIKNSVCFTAEYKALMQTLHFNICTQSINTKLEINAIHINLFVNDGIEIFHFAFFNRQIHNKLCHFIIDLEK